MKVKIFSVSLFCLFIASFGEAYSHPISDNQRSNTSLCGATIVLHGKHKTKGRPKAPSKQRIHCMYENGDIHIRFEFSEGQSQMTVTDLDTGFSCEYQFDSSSETTVHIGTLSSARIEVKTANGNEYEGFLGVE